MKIRSVRHKGLRHLIEDDDASGLQAQFIEKIRNIISFLEDMGQESELRTIASWKAHKLTGDQKDVWSLFVSRNWRITFRIDQTEIEIIDLDYVDYH
jgi:toxin HigB-1